MQSLDALTANILAQKAGTHFPGNSYASCGSFLWGTVGSNPRASESFVSHLLPEMANKPLVDLGAGPYVEGYRFAQLVRASSYVAIEPHNDVELSHVITEEITHPKIPDRNIPYMIFKIDMLSALRALPNDSVCILASGIDRDIIPDEDYLGQVRLQILRVLHPEGIFFSKSSEITGIEGYCTYFKMDKSGRKFTRDQLTL